MKLLQHLEVFDLKNQRSMHWIISIFFLLSFTALFGFNPDTGIFRGAKVKILKRQQASDELQKTFQIKGIVTDSEGMPLPGVTVYVTDVHPKNKNEEQSKDFIIRGTQTDFNGEFSLNVSVNHYLNITALGYKVYSQEILSEDKTDYAITLEQEVNSLEAVVLVGYGKQKRKEVSSAISSVKVGKVQENLGAYPSFDRGLAGLIKGVQVFQGPGIIGQSVDINIRGITSPFSGSDNNPLFVIDGVPFQTEPIRNATGLTRFNRNPNPLQTINPNDIESIDVLKDASATAIYGSRGANGVIIVKTKKGKRGQKPKIHFSSVSSFGVPVRMLDYANMAQYKQRVDHILKNSAAFANKSTALSIDAVDEYNFLANMVVDGTGANRKITYNGLKEDFFGDADTNWSKEVYRPVAFTQNYNVSIRGGGANTSYGLTIGHTDQEGLLSSENYKQYNFSTNLTSQINKTISLGGTANVSYSNHQRGLLATGAMNDILDARPDIAPYDENGNFKRINWRGRSGDQKRANPLAKATQHDVNVKTFSVLGNLFAEVELLRNLNLKGSVNVGRFSNDRREFTPESIVGIIPQENESELSDETSIATNVTLQSTLDYTITLAEKHNLYALVGISQDRMYTDRTSHRYTGFSNDQLNISSYAETTNDKDESNNQSGLNSLFSRASYNYDEKYFITLNFRTDISSKFGPGNERAYFPSVSASWNIAQEGFLKHSDAINDLRLRIGYGRTGSQNVRDFVYKQNFISGSGFLYNAGLVTRPSGTLPNPDIKWAVTNEFNIGLDFGFLNNRIRGSVDGYNRKTTDALMTSTYPLESGARQYTQNFADITNKGIEIDVFGEIIQTQDITWSVGFNIAKNINTLDRFNKDGLSSAIHRFYEIGREVNIITGYVVEGIFQTQKEIDDLNAKAPGTGAAKVYQEVGTAPGDYKYKDLDGDGKITTKDQEYLGSSQPDFFGGFNTQISYKGLSLSANFSYSIGGESTYAGDSSSGYRHDISRNIQTRYLDTWTPTNTDAQYPRAVMNGGYRINRNLRRSSALVHDTSHLRLNSLQLRYDFFAWVSMIKKVGLSGVVLTATATNLWTLTNFPAADPSSIGSFASTDSTESRDPYPIAKTWQLGININF